MSIQTILSDLDSSRETLEELYRHFHRNPELSLQEYRTADRIEEELRGRGIEDVQRIAKTGLVVTLRNGDGPIVAMRGDIDALPITPGGAGRFRVACAGAVRQATASSAFSWYSSIWSKFMYR